MKNKIYLFIMIILILKVSSFSEFNSISHFMDMVNKTNDDSNIEEIKDYFNSYFETLKNYNLYNEVILPNNSTTYAKHFELNKIYQDLRSKTKELLKIQAKLKSNLEAIEDELKEKNIKLSSKNEINKLKYKALKEESIQIEDLLKKKKDADKLYYKITDNAILFKDTTINIKTLKAELDKFQNISSKNLTKIEQANENYLNLQNSFSSVSEEEQKVKQKFKLVRKDKIRSDQDNKNIIQINEFFEKYSNNLKGVLQNQTSILTKRKKKLQDLIESNKALKGKKNKITKNKNKLKKIEEAYSKELNTLYENLLELNSQKNVIKFNIINRNKELKSKKIEVETQLNNLENQLNTFIKESGISANLNSKLLENKNKIDDLIRKESLILK